MLIINKNQKKKQYQLPPMPNYEQLVLKHIWLNKQKMEAELINIKSISIQFKDIKQMIYSEDFRLLSLYAKYQRVNHDYNDEDFITIYKYSKGSKKDINKELIFNIINADWIIKFDEINKKSLTELNEELSSIENQIQLLKEKLKKNNTLKSSIMNRIILLNYKKTCLDTYIKENFNSKTKKLVNEK